MTKKQRTIEPVTPPAPLEVGPISIALADIGDAWDLVDRAISNILVAQPHTMTHAAAELQCRQRGFREALRDAAMSAIHTKCE